MRIRHALLLAATAAAALVAAGPPADAGDGFIARRPLRVVPTSGQADLEGGVEAWLRVTNGKRIVQGFTVWFRGLQEGPGIPFEDSGATLFMANPGENTLEEVASFAVSDNGSGIFQVRVDSSHGANPELPLGVERVLNLVRAPVEVRLVSATTDDVTVLRGNIGAFRFREVDEDGTGERVRSRQSTLRLPEGPVPDEDAEGAARVFRRKARGDGEVEQGIVLVASGLTEDEDYEVWVEDSDGELQELLVPVATTPEGLGYFSLDTRSGDDVADLDVDDVRELYGRRVELRRSGSEDPSLVGFFPRVR